MGRQKISGWRGLVLGVLALGAVLMLAEPASAFRSGPHRFSSHRHHHYRHVYRPRVRSHFGFGFGFYEYPYSPYYPYYDPYDYYAPYYYPARPYAPGEHRHFPAFRLPEFFHYPGAMGKGEAESQALGLPGNELQVGQESTSPERARQ